MLRHNERIISRNVALLNILVHNVINFIVLLLKNADETLLQWFKDNRMKVNHGKYQLLINTTKESFQIKIGNETVSNSKYEKLQLVKVDHELNLNEHV